MQWTMNTTIYSQYMHRGRETAASGSNEPGRPVLRLQTKYASCIMVTMETEMLCTDNWTMHRYTECVSRIKHTYTRCNVASKFSCYIFISELLIFRYILYIDQTENIVHI